MAERQPAGLPSALDEALEAGFELIDSSDVQQLEQEQEQGQGQGRQHQSRNPTPPRTRYHTSKCRKNYSEYLIRNKDSNIILLCNIRDEEMSTRLDRVLQQIIDKKPKLKMTILDQRGQSFRYLSFTESKRDEMMAPVEARLKALKSDTGHQLCVLRVHAASVDAKGGQVLPTGTQLDPSHQCDTLILRDLPGTVTRDTLMAELTAAGVGPVHTRFLLRSGDFAFMAALQFASLQEAAQAHTRLNSLVLFGSHLLIRAEYEKRGDLARPPPPETASEREQQLENKILAFYRDSTQNTITVTSPGDSRQSRAFACKLAAALSLRCAADGDTPLEHLRLTKPPPAAAAGSLARAAVPAIHRQPYGPSPSGRGFALQLGSRSRASPLASMLSARSADSASLLGSVQSSRLVDGSSVLSSVQSHDSGVVSGPASSHRSPLASLVPPQDRTRSATFSGTRRNSFDHASVSSNGAAAAVASLVIGDAVGTGGNAGGGGGGRQPSPLAGHLRHAPVIVLSSAAAQSDAGVHSWRPDEAVADLDRSPSTTRSSSRTPALDATRVAAVDATPRTHSVVPYSAAGAHRRQNSMYRTK